MRKSILGPLSFAVLRISAALRRAARPPAWTSATVYLAIVLYIVFFSWLSIMRHQTFQSNAMDLGYTDQVVWNTLHGRFLRFSTYQDAPIDLPLSQFRRTDILLSYHVELILAPISLLYLVYDSPATLLVLQSVAIGLGALPLYWLARDHLRSGIAGLVFALAYLLAPVLEGANLSDFHAVTLAPCLLLLAFYALSQRRYRTLIVLCAVALLVKEEISLLILAIGLYVLIFRREWVSGAILAGMGLGWFLLCTQWILPTFNGLPSSPFVHRLALFGPTIGQSVRAALSDPLLVWRWLRQPEIAAYVSGLLASAGFMSLFSPVVLALSAPVWAMNVFSTWSWTYSEGAHYSASIVPFVMLSAVYGLGALARRLSAWWRIPQRSVVLGLAAVMLLVSGFHHYQIGISPLARSYHPPRLTDHDRLAHAFVDRIPPDASLSAGSGLYPHLAHREKAYFFPAVNDAEYILLDVTGTPYPITTVDVRARVQGLLASGEYGVLAAEDGLLLLQRGLTGEAAHQLPDAFYDFARVDAASIPHPLHVRFGDALELVGYGYSIQNTVHAHQLPATVTTYWRVLPPVTAVHVVSHFFSRADGALVYLYDGPTAATVWYPARQWQAGEVICVETPVLSVGRLRDAMVAVVPAAADPWSAQKRLPVDVRAGGPEVYDQGTLVRLFSFP